MGEGCGRAEALRGTPRLGKSGQRGRWEGEGKRRGSAEDGAQGPGPGNPRKRFGQGRLEGGPPRAALPALRDWGRGECGTGGLETGEAAREKGLAARTAGFPPALADGRESPASALLGGGGDRLEGRRARRDWRGRLGQWGAAQQPRRLLVNTRLPGTRRSPGWD